MYYKTYVQWYGPTQKLFEAGERCNCLYIILNGVIDIQISDGEETQVIDSLGKGSVIGINYLIKKEKWVYSAVNLSTITAKILKVDENLLNHIKNK